MQIRSSTRFLIATVATFAMLLLASPAFANHITLPAKMAAMGDSLSTAWGASGGPDDDLIHSFSTGSGITSHSARFNAMSSVDDVNVAQAGTRLDQLVSVGQDPVTGQPNPPVRDQVMQLPRDTDYVTITVGSSDACRMNSRPAPGLIARRAAELMARLDSRLNNARPTVMVVPMPNWIGLWNALKDNPTARERWANACARLFGEGAADRAAANAAFIQSFNQRMASACDQATDNDLRCVYAGRVTNINWNLSLVSTWDAFHPSVKGQALLSRLSWSASPYRLAAFGLQFQSQPAFNRRQKRLTLDLHTAPNARVAVKVLTSRGRQIGSAVFNADGGGDLDAVMSVPGYRGQEVLRLVFNVRLLDQKLTIKRKLNV